MIRISPLLLRWLALWLALAAPLGALEVRQTIWGFDGHVVPGRFNPISILVDNPRPAPFDGQLLLSPVDGVGGQRGTEYVHPVFLAPHTARWVQFHIFIGNNVGHYAIQWGRGPKDRSELSGDISLGPPACVWLRDTDNPFGLAGALKSFPDELFPTSVIATDALGAVVLDHTPRWEPARREAFLDWLKGGGTVHLLPAADGKYPVFPEGLEALNTEHEITRIGAGLIRHHQIGAREMSEKYLAEHGYPPRTLKQTQAPVAYDLESLISQRLSSLTRPTVNWTTIHLLALAYIAAIGPLHYRFRRKLDYRISILLFLGIVTAFGLAFAIVGRRGYGESQTVNSLTIARALGGGRHDCMQWICAFATAGDLYTLTHEAPANLYDIGSMLDAAGSRVLNGKDGRIQMDIPLYSSRTFVHRAVMTGDDTTVTVEKREGDEIGPRRLRLRLGPGFPKEFAEARLLVNGEFYDLVLRNGALEASDNPAVAASSYFSRDKLSPLAYQNQFGRNQNPDAHRNLMPLLAARALGAQDVFLQTVIEPPLPADQMRLCIVAPAPQSFRLRGPGFDRERGWVLYVQNLILP
jgi:hypothetical protein